MLLGQRRQLFVVPLVDADRDPRCQLFPPPGSHSSSCPPKLCITVVNGDAQYCDAMNAVKCRSPVIHRIDGRPARSTPSSGSAAEKMAQPSTAAILVRKIYTVPAEIMQDLALFPHPALMFAVKPLGSRVGFQQKPEVGKRMAKLLAGGGVSRRRLNKLSCAGWLPHDRGFVSGLPRSRGERRQWPAHNRRRGFPNRPRRPPGASNARCALCCDLLLASLVTRSLVVAERSGRSPR